MAPGYLRCLASRIPTPDGVWHRDSHYWRKYIGWGTQDTDFNIRELLEEFLQNFFGEEIVRVRATQTP